MPPGHRDLWLFLAITAMSWLTEDPKILYREAQALALEVSTWPEGQMRSQMQAIFKRAQQAAHGKTITWRGREIDPRYHFRNETIIEWLEITPEEQREMRTLLGADEIRRRHREAERQRSYETGAVQQDQASYLAQAAERRRQGKLTEKASRRLPKHYRSIAAPYGAGCTNDVASLCVCMVGEALRSSGWDWFTQPLRGHLFILGGV